MRINPWHGRILLDPFAIMRSQKKGMTCVYCFDGNTRVGDPVEHGLGLVVHFLVGIINNV
jgi:hypothetical protein